MKSMKRLSLALTILFALLTTDFAQAQVCPGAVLSDDFSNPSLWTVMGTTSGGTPGTLAITGGVTNYDDFRGRQTYRLVRPLNGAIANDFFWRIEFENTLNTTQVLSGAMLLALTSNDQHPRTAAAGNYTETNNNTIEVLLANPLNSTTAGNDSVILSSKLGTNRSFCFPRIGIDRGVKYYYRLERVQPGEVVLSIFDDPFRTSHIPGSPVCCNIDPLIEDFNFLQQGVWTTSSQNRFMTGETDNLCIYDNVTTKGCSGENCDLNPDLWAIDNGNCTVTFINNSSAGPGMTMFAYGIIDFGDGTWGQIAPGVPVTHTYANGTSNWVCLTVRGHDALLNCCEERHCFPVEVHCDKGGREKTAASFVPAELEVFPNPTEGKVTLRGQRDVKSVHVYDAAGRRVKTVSGLGKVMDLDLSSLERGIYFLDVEVDEIGSVKRKVSLQ